MLCSDCPGERDNAGVMAHRLTQSRGLCWAEVIDPPPPVERSLPDVGTWRSTCLELQKRPGCLRKWEVGFVRDSPRFHRISSKQRNILDEIAERVLGVRP